MHLEQRLSAWLPSDTCPAALPYLLHHALPYFQHALRQAALSAGALP